MRSTLPMDSYHYMPLDISAGEIRLLSLRLEPRLGTSHDPLDCTLACFPIRSCPAYKCLSYTWGDEAVPATFIYMQGHLIPVSQNVDDALRAIWQSHPTVWIWIDALCINQNDILERNAQVPRMTEIYECAENVIVWLGTGTDETAAVMKYLHANRDALHSRDYSLITPHTRAQIWWPLVQHLLSRPWWKRLWILQEVAVARSVEIMCGSDSIPWDLLGIKFVAEDQVAAPLQGKMYSDWQRAIEVRNIRFLHQGLKTRGQQAMDWKDLLVRSRAAEVSLPVDKLYGLLGLAQRQLPGLQIDYGAPLQVVLKQFTRLIIQRDRRLDFICMSRGVSLLAGLPSWIPDLGAGFRIKPFNGMGVIGRFGVLFDANNITSKSSNDRMEPDVQFNFSQGGDALSVDGVVVDEITRLAGVISDLDETWHDMQARYATRALSLFPEARSTPDAHYALGRSLVEALQITLTADNGPGKKRITTARLLTDETLIRTPDTLDTKKLSSRPSKLVDHLVASSDPVTVSWANRDRTFIGSSKGYMGLGPEHARLGDIICVIFGCDVPVILRCQGEHHIFVGESYVHGLMYGFAMDDWKRRNLHRETFLLL